MSENGDDINEKEQSTRVPSALYPVLPLRDIVMFPGMIVPLFVGREKSINALEESIKKDSKMILVAQKDAGQDDPAPEDIFRIGVMANILQLLRLPDGTVKVLVEGVQRAEINYYLDNEEYFEADASEVEDVVGNADEVEALTRSIIKAFEHYVKLNKKVPAEITNTLKQIDDPGRLVDTVASHVGLRIEEKQEVLETKKVSARLEKVFSLMEREVGVLTTEKKIRSRVRHQMEKTKKEYYLNEQMKAIQRELGDEEGKDEIQELEEKIEKTKLSKEAREKARGELKKLKNMSPMSAEATVVRNYLDWLLSLPWKKPTKLTHDIDAAQKILDEDHYALEKVKERVIEFLAVQQRTKSLKGQILCFVGPPGVGKTSLAKSIARASSRTLPVSLWAVYVMNPKYAVTEEHISAQCPVRLSNQ